MFDEVSNSRTSVSPALAVMLLLVGVAVGVIIIMNIISNTPQCGNDLSWWQFEPRSCT